MTSSFWYIQGFGVLMSLGFLLAASYTLYLARKTKILFFDVFDLILVIFSAALIGSRLMYVLNYFEYYRFHPAEILKLWNGGFIFYGGFILSLAAIYFFCRKKNINFESVLNLLAPGAALMVFFMEIGNLIFSIEFSAAYFAGAMIFLFILLSLSQRSKLKKGGALFIFFYGLSRFLIDFFVKENTNPFSEPIFFNMELSNWISLILIVFGFFLLFKKQQSKKTIWSFFLTVALLFGTTITGVKAAGNFQDIPETHLHFAAIESLFQKKIISGYNDGTFQPENQISRAEALKILLGAAYGNISPSQNQRQFKDVKENFWYAPYVSLGVEKKIVQGFSDGTFKPERSINKVEFLKMLFSAFNQKFETFEDDPYTDVPAKSWFGHLVQQAKTMKLAESMNDGKFHADFALNRGEAAEILYRYIFIRNQKLQNFNPGENWSYYDAPLLYAKFKISSDFEILKKNSKQLVFRWNGNEESFGDYRRIQGNNAVLSVSIEENFGSGKQSFQSRLENYAAQLRRTVIREIKRGEIWGFILAGRSETEGIMDAYFSLPGNRLLSFVGSYGMGPKQEELKERLYLMEMSFEYNKDGGDMENLLSKVREQILLEGSGKKTLELFPDELKIIETDSLGTGVGAVDYYYSEATQTTIKYQRSNDVILGVKNGKTTAF